MKDRVNSSELDNRKNMSFFDTSFPLSHVTYDSSDHRQYVPISHVTQDSGPYIVGKRKAYKDHVSRWYKKVLVDSNLMIESDEKDSVTTIRYAIESIFDDIIYVIYDNGFRINNTNLFKEDLIHFIYRLSRV